jgi:hypothetical protein
LTAAPVHPHVDEQWWGSEAELRALLELGYWGGYQDAPGDEGGVWMHCPLAPGTDHYVHALERRADHVEFTCSRGCNEGAIRAKFLEVQGLAASLDDVDPPAATAGAGLRIRGADLSRVRPIDWLWAKRLPIGYLCLLLGAEGIGKGVLIAWLIARLTRGELAGSLEGTPTRVLIVGDEDSFDTVILPRLYAAGADLAQVDELCDEASEVLDIRRDAEQLRELIRAGDYSFVYVDSLLDVLAVDTDDWRSKPVRDALRPLRRAARDLDVAVLGALHPNKGQRSSFRDLVSGTHAYNASSRSSLLLAQHPDDEGRRVLVRGKGNLSSAPPSFEFALEGLDLEINGHGFSLPVVADERDGELGVEDMLKPERPAPVRENLADQLDALGTGEIQSRAELAHALGRESDDRSVGRALDQLEEDGRWLKEGRGKWRSLGIGASSEAPMSKGDGGGDA